MSFKIEWKGKIKVAEIEISRFQVKAYLINKKVISMVFFMLGNPPKTEKGNQKIGSIVRDSTRLTCNKTTLSHECLSKNVINPSLPTKVKSFHFWRLFLCLKVIFFKCPKDYV